MLVIEVASPQMDRIRQQDLYSVPLLRFGPTGEQRRPPSGFSRAPDRPSLAECNGDLADAPTRA
jgi:hypothetical protein